MDDHAIRQFSPRKPRLNMRLFTTSPNLKFSTRLNP